MQAQQSYRTPQRSPSKTNLESPCPKRYLVGLKAQQCSCAKFQDQLKVQQHLPTCEQVPIKVRQQRDTLGFLYKKTALAHDSQVLNSQYAMLNKEQQIKTDVDQIAKDVEVGLYKFLGQCDQIKEIKLWSSLVKWEDVQALLETEKPEEANLMHASILSFNERINKFRKECQAPPPIASTRSEGFPLSIDAWCNKHLINAVSLNLMKSTCLTEVVICGLNLHDTVFRQLANGLKNQKTVKKLSLNFCINRREQLQQLMPVLTDPEAFPVRELSLAANGLTDADFGEQVAKIVSMHMEKRDEVVWKYALRDELPPTEALEGLKKFDLSFNKLGSKTVFAIGKALKNDKYLISLNLKQNMLNDENAKLLLSYLEDNETLFNLDMRYNVDIKQKTFRKCAMKLLGNYTKSGQTADPRQWISDMKYFDTKLLEVQIPTVMVTNYAKKLEAIRQGCLSTVMASKTHKYHSGAKSARGKRKICIVSPGSISTAVSSTRPVQTQKLMSLMQQRQGCFSGQSLDSIREETAINDSRETYTNINTAQSTHRELVTKVPMSMRGQRKIGLKPAYSDKTLSTTATVLPRGSQKTSAETLD